MSLTSDEAKRETNDKTRLHICALRRRLHECVNVLKRFNFFRECDLEEILIHQTTPTVPIHGGKTGFQGVLKCIPNAPKLGGLRPPLSKTGVKAKGVRVSSLS